MIEPNWTARAAERFDEGGLDNRIDLERNLAGLAKLATVTSYSGAFLGALSEDERVELDVHVSLVNGETPSLTAAFNDAQFGRPMTQVDSSGRILDFLRTLPEDDLVWVRDVLIFQNSSDQRARADAARVLLDKAPVPVLSRTTYTLDRKIGGISVKADWRRGNYIFLGEADEYGVETSVACAGPDSSYYGYVRYFDGQEELQRTKMKPTEGEGGVDEAEFAEMNLVLASLIKQAG